MDKLDYRILEILQQDASVGLADLAARVGLSTTPCWRRIQRLKEDGVIQAQVALCDPVRLGLGLTVFVTVKAARHDDAWTTRFLDGVAGIPEILEVYRMAGEVDYLLKVVVSDIAGYDRVYKRLIKVAELVDVSSGFVMEVVRHTTALPLEQVRPPERPVRA
ncbi:Lrp/AsnC family transcriptional regulator [uncultured Castellaniella sp.]|uniref:Lrp/AsnC family transcriptional regulator n=1 Tax=uncultured Castellaniella sp. TaxID=647907 RepID=UPI00262025BE|nr:Lrp/AsnC family transcriptional regulator [uncultured Castellaniella sp.]